MTLFSRRSNSKSGDLLQESPVVLEVVNDTQMMELEAESRMDGLRNISSCVKSYVSALEAMAPQSMALAKSLVQQGKFYREKTDYARGLVSVGQAFQVLGAEIATQTEALRGGLSQRMEELAKAAGEYERQREEARTRRAALEDRRAKLQKKKKPELEEQVKGAELLYNESVDRLNTTITELAALEESLLKNAIRDIESVHALSFKKVLESFENSGASQGSTFALDRKESIKRSLPPTPKGTQEQQPPASPSAHGLAAILVENRSQPNEPIEPRPSRSSSVASKSRESSTCTAEPEEQGHGTTPMSPNMPPSPMATDLPIDDGDGGCSYLVKAVLAYEGDEGELSFEKGQAIQVYKRLEGGYLFGRLVDSEEKGVFPSNYVREASVKRKDDDPMNCPEAKKTLEPTAESATEPRRKPPKASATSTVTLEFDAQPRQQQGQSAADDPSALRAPSQQQQTRAFSYLPPNGQISFVPKKAVDPKPTPRDGQMEDAVVEPKCRECGCDDYCTNVFKKGQCNNCFHSH